MLPPPPEAELDGEADEKALEAYMSASLQWWETSIAEVRARLHARDDEMRQTYAKRMARVVTDLREAIVPGDHVAVCVRTPTKLAPRWKGPWLVLRLVGENCAAAELMKPDGHTCVVALANVKRWRGEVAVA